jgi:hypothetical protein
MGDFLLQFVVPTLDVIYGTGYICLWEDQPLPLVSMDLIEDICFNALNDLDDTDTPANTTTFTNYVITQWIDGDRRIALSLVSSCV